ncbi:MAG TPA: LPS assembly protein LptD [Alphaproteobacteria bacterium]|jgi:LPS-assembly protein
MLSLWTMALVPAFGQSNSIFGGGSDSLLNDAPATVNPTFLPNGAPPAPPTPPAAPAAADDAGAYLLKADEITFDESLGLVVARGNVEISQGQRVLMADTVTYNQKTDIMTASGNVSLLEPTGDVLFSEYAEFTDDLKTGAVNSIRMLMSDNSRMAANGGRRLGGVVTEMSKAVYSPCELCSKDPSRPPLWQIKAVKVTHDTVAKTVEYEDAQLEMFGLPVLYLPYFSHPDPSVKRQSGFMFPSYGNSSDLGTFVSTPYYWVISEDKDLTFTPTYTSGQGMVYSGEYRQRLTNGAFQLSGSYTNPTDPPDGADMRGHIRGNGRFDLDETWRAGFNVDRATDDTYLRRYGFGSDNKSLTSDAFVEGFRGRSYANATAMSFQGLRVTDDPGQTPLILPMANYNFRGDPDRNGGRLNFDVSALSLTRDEGTSSDRISTKTSWNLPHIASSGEIFGVTASLQADAYHVNDVVAPIYGPQKDGYTGRLFPQVKLDYRYPFSRQSGKITEMIEPIAGVVVAPRGGNPSKLPNEDSQDIEFDDTNLFDDTPFTGVDRVEGGQRVIYGLRGGVYGEGGGSTTAFVGQSYRFNEDNEFVPGSGLNDQLSDIVGRLTISPAQYFDLMYRFRVSAEELDTRTNEVKLGIGNASKLRLDLSYFFVDGAASNNQFPDRQEVYASLQAGLTRNWGAFGFTRNDLTDDGGFIGFGGGLRYTDECLIFQTSLSRSFTYDRDLVPSTTLLFMFVFKNLGDFQTSAF